MLVRNQFIITGKTETYLTLCFGDDADMDKVDGFYLYLSDKEWITVNQPANTIFVNHYEITDHSYHNIGTEYKYESKSGHDWTQIWNKDGSGRWSEVQDRHYSWSNMPME